MAPDPMDIQKALNAGRTLAPQAFYFVDCNADCDRLGVQFLRPKNKMIYEPKIKYREDNKAPPPIADSLFELLDKIGLDAVTFLLFLRLVRTLFSGVAILTCGILLPFDYIHNQKYIPTDKRIFFISCPYMAYLITFFVVYLMYIYWRDIVKLRNEWFRSPDYLQSFYARTICIAYVPEKLRSDEGISRILTGLKIPYPTTSVHIGHKVGQLPDVIKYHNQTVREFKAVLVKFFNQENISQP
uniref:Uncharacterized protein n=1 Tax=Moniliophthora roreri TaxID=221103 RepID=A0A0W0F141_MONRR